jgi:hypothetical protein
VLNLPSTGFGEYAFVWANRPTTTTIKPYTPELAYQYNSTGAINTIARVERGHYRVYMPDVYPKAGGNVQLSAYGSGSSYCNVGSWGTNVGSPLEVSDDLVVQVYCFDASGNPADSQFTALYHDHGLGGESLAYLWASEPETLRYYTPAKYSYNSFYPDESPYIVHHPLLGEEEVVGYYLVYLGGPTTDGPLHVTTYGNEPNHCQVIERSLFPTVQCYSRDGVPRNMRFSLAYSQNRVFGSPDTVGAYAYVERSSSGARILSAFNSAGPFDGALVTTWARGRFRIDFPRLAPTYSKSTVLVTAEHGYGSYLGVRKCKVAGWMKLSDDVAVWVDCYDSVGGLSDSSFSVTVLTDARF